MAPPKRPWFRLYVEMIWDRKIRRLPEKSRWLFVAMLAAARQSPLPGYLMIDDDTPMETDDICDAAAMKLKDVRQGLADLSGIGLIEEDDETGAWWIPKWDERQFESDETTKRTAKHRSKEQGRNVPSPHDATPPETEAESEEPPTPAERGIETASPRTEGKNPRALGTNPRKVAEREADERRRRQAECQTCDGMGVVPTDDGAIPCPDCREVKAS